MDTILYDILSEGHYFMEDTILCFNCSQYLNVLSTTLCDTFWSVTCGRYFFFLSGIVHQKNNLITEILLKVALNTKNLPNTMNSLIFQVYIRRAYTAYDVNCVQHCEIDEGLFIVEFKFLLPRSHPNRLDFCWLISVYTATLHHTHICTYCILGHNDSLQYLMIVYSNNLQIHVILYIKS